MIKGKLIILAVTGGIAAYQSAEITRRLIKSGARVKVVMTKNATEFITPLTMQTLSKNPVITDMFSPYEREEIEHISLSDELDLLLVAVHNRHLALHRFAGMLSARPCSSVRCRCPCPA